MQICGGKLSEGVFVGSFLSMSSTAVVYVFALFLLTEFIFLKCVYSLLHNVLLSSSGGEVSNRTKL